MFQQVFSKVTVLFIILFVGAFVRYRRILTKDSTKALADLVLIVALPFFYFYTLATNFNAEVLKSIWVLPVFAAVTIMIGYTFARLFSRLTALEAPARATFIYLSTFSNCGFLAIPIAHALYGPEGIVRVVFFNLGFNLLYWTLGVQTLKSSVSNGAKREGGLLRGARNLINSGTIGLLLGVTVGLFAIKLPSFIFESTRILGVATIPLALIVVGSIMATGNIKSVLAYKGPLALIILCKMIIVPVLALLITGMIEGLTPLVRAVIVLQAAMPSASTTPVFTTRFGGDSQFASIGVFATHIVSIITVPLFMSLV